MADAGGFGLPRVLVWNWRDASERLSRVREQLPRLRIQFGRALDYWSGLQELIEDVLAIKEEQICQLRAQLVLPPPASADGGASAAAPSLGPESRTPRWSALQGLESAQGEVHVLSSSLRKARAMCQLGERVLKDLPSLSSPAAAGGEGGGRAAADGGPGQASSEQLPPLGGAEQATGIDIVPDLDDSDGAARLGDRMDISGESDWGVSGAGAGAAADYGGMSGLGAEGGREEEEEGEEGRREMLGS